ncbi:unnamed protein product [Adineta steineri]|uniref:Transglutaminase-like domain-containing protein n=1 Tax=Adineta steineri TaxID=433720 RepID=A0A815CX54_9BILA|nr:unnamed protein product [Adineta steineri]CAF3597523.1 unnamed protein product [Adineta steineri]
MGCKCNRVTPITEPIEVKDPVPVKDNEPVISTIPYRNDSRSKSTSSSNNEEIIDDDRLIDSLIQASRVNRNFIEIEIADSKAFNKSFIQQRQQAIDNHSYRSTIDSWRPNSLQQLVNMIQSLSNNQSLIDCHWIIFYWITCNIAYDTVSYFSKNYQNQSAENVFRTKQGVCAGYANIYKYLCDQLNLKCEIVSGYSKGYGFDSREDVPTDTDHAWNAIEIDGHWYLMESTWGAGHLTDEKVFQRQLNTYYFFPRPNEMIYHHLPENDKWQLLRIPIQMKQYLQMPKIHPSYFQLELNLISPYNQASIDLLPQKSYALVLIRAPSDVQLMASLKLHEKDIEGGHQVEFDTKRQLYRCYFAPNIIGKYKVTIFGKRGNTDVGSYSAAVDLILDVQQKIKNPISYPKTWAKFFDLNLNIISPKNTHLINIHNGMTHAEFLIQTPDDVELLGRLVHIDNEEKIKGGDEVFYDRHKKLWRCRFASNADGIYDAQISAKKKSDSGLYTCVVSFKIDAKNIPTPTLSYPETWAKFFDLNLNIISPKNTHLINVHNGMTHAEILIQTPDEVALLGSLVHTNDREKIKGADEVFYDRHKKLWRCKFAPNVNGIFDAQILAKKKSDSGTYTSVVSFKIDAKNIPTPTLSYPKTWQIFYDLDLKIEAPKNRAAAIWSNKASYSEIRMSAPDDVILSCTLEYNGRNEQDCTLEQFDHNKQQWQLLFAPQHTGHHKLTIFAKRQSDYAGASSKSAVQFDLNVTKLQQKIKFPTLFEQFSTKKCQIYEPINGVLKSGTIVPVKCYIPGAKDIGLQVDSKWVETNEYENSILKTNVAVGLKDVTIYAKYGQDTTYNGLIKYSVE